MSQAGQDEPTDRAPRGGDAGGERRLEDHHRSDATGGFERLLDEDGRTIQRGLE